MPEIWSWTSSNFEMRGQGLKISLCVFSKKNPYGECNVVCVFSVAVSPVNEFWCSNFSENLFRCLSDLCFTVEIFEADSLASSLKKKDWPPVELDMKNWKVIGPRQKRTKNNIWDIQLHSLVRRKMNRNGCAGDCMLRNVKNRRKRFWQFWTFFLAERSDVPDPPALQLHSVDPGDVGGR